MAFVRLDRPRWNFHRMLTSHCTTLVLDMLSETVHDLFMRIRMNASWSMPRLESMSRSQFFQSRRHFSIHANERSTTQRFGITLNVWSRFRFATWENLRRTDLRSSPFFAVNMTQ